MLQVINRRPGDKLKCFAENLQIFDYDHSLNQRTVQFSFLLLLLLLHVIVFWHTHLDTGEQRSI